MVTLLVATSTDPASINPANVLLKKAEWVPGPSLQEAKSFTYLNAKILQHDKRIVEVDYLDKKWEEATNEVVDEIIFFSKHTAASGRPSFTIHPIGVPHLTDKAILPQGGMPGWAAPPNPRIGSWLRLLKKIVTEHNLADEFEVTLEATHHGPVTEKPTMFLEIGSSEKHWKRHDAAEIIASLVWQGLGFQQGLAEAGKWPSGDGNNTVLLGIGGGHYVPRHMDIALKEGVWVSHLLSGYSMPMELEDANMTNGDVGLENIKGTWKRAIKVVFEATKTAFPNAKILAHLDHKSFKSWQKKAVVRFLAEQNIGIGSARDFCSRNV